MSTDSPNPYASPRSPDQSPAENEVWSSGLPLYSARSIAVGTFFGSFAAAAVLMAINYWRLGRRSAAWWMLGLGWIGTIAYAVVVGVLLPDGVPSIVMFIPQIIVAYMLQSKFQQPLIDEHVSRGGQLASAWWGFGISLVVAVLFLLSLIPILLPILLFAPDAWLPPE